MLRRTRKRLAGVAARAMELEKRRTDLHDQAPTAFKDEPAKRDDVLAALDAAKALLVEASEGANRAAGAESRFVVDLVYAVETGGGTRPEPTKPTREKTAGASGGARRSAAASPAPGPAAAQAPPPAPAPPKKKQKGADDFEP